MKKRYLKNSDKYAANAKVGDEVLEAVKSVRAGILIS
jgi:hypothetical protein